MAWISDPQAWLALATLTGLEIVLGIDNIIFISILAGKLPSGQQARARSLGLMLAMGTRVLLLVSLTWIMRLTTPLFAILGQDISGRDLILATAIAYSVNGRLAVQLDRLQGLGFMPSSVVGGGGSAAATAKLMKLDGPQT